MRRRLKICYILLTVTFKRFFYSTMAHDTSVVINQIAPPKKKEFTAL